MAPSSSANKVAKLASRGKGKKVRFQGGTVFPAIVAVIVIVMLGLVVYARASRPTDGSGPPRLGDHWHAAFGIYVCDHFEPKLLGSAEATSVDVAGNTVYTNKNFQLTGIHSHGDGVIHYHPYGSKATGTRARLGVFLDTYNVKLNDTVLELPPDQGGMKWDTKSFKCGTQDSQLKVRVWNDYSKPGEFHDYVTDFRNIRIDRNGMVFVVAVVPRGADIPQPDSAPKLPELGAVDGGATVSVPASSNSETSTPGVVVTPTIEAPVSGSTSASETTIASAPGDTSSATSLAPATYGG
ncbi:MAG: hypothetical protein ABIQ39_16690 [Ilumatobacteraceae bacterium]